jgi:hypothetical protein
MLSKYLKLSMNKQRYPVYHFGAWWRQFQFCSSRFLKMHLPLAGGANSVASIYFALCTRGVTCLIFGATKQHPNPTYGRCENWNERYIVVGTVRRESPLSRPNRLNVYIPKMKLFVAGTSTIGLVWLETPYMGVSYGIQKRLERRGVVTHEPSFKDQQSCDTE